MSLPSSPTYWFFYSCLLSKGYAVLEYGRPDLVVTMRGTGMIDVFDRRTWTPVGFLDFDLDRAIHLDAAFGAPLIGLPFTSALGRAMGVSLQGFDDLRRCHHYGFFIDDRYRNQGAKGVWNLDELLIAVALECAEDRGLTGFRIAPTGDTADYYRRKFSARPGPAISDKKNLVIRLGANRSPLPHIRTIRSTAGGVYLEVPLGPDPGWPQILH